VKVITIPAAVVKLKLSCCGGQRLQSLVVIELLRDDGDDRAPADDVITAQSTANNNAALLSVSKV